MTFSQIQGNQDVCSALTGMVRSGRVPHAILFHEDDGGGAMPIALAFLQYLYCAGRTDDDSCGSCATCNKITKLIHPDVHFIFPTNAPNLSASYMAQWRQLVLDNPCFTEADLMQALGVEGKSSLITVAEARAMLDTLSLSALEGGYRSVVIYLPEKMNQDSANRLLKIIEEPPSLTQFLLICHDPSKVLTTITSRCQCIRVRPASRQERIGTAESEETYADLFMQLMSAFQKHDLVEALEVGEAIASLPSRESAKEFCRYASGCMRQLFLCQQGMSSIGTVSDGIAAIAPKVRKTFPRLALEALDRAGMLIGRNVNLKILFADLVGRLYKIYGQ